MNNFFTANLAEVDPIIAEAIDDETRRQSNGLELIASENFAGKKVIYRFNFQML
jgi:glycine hydroxymethyltransferase